jgi:Right handed beta helix region
MTGLFKNAISRRELAAAGGAALVGYLPAGTAASTTTTQAELRTKISVGASYPTLQLALNYAASIGAAVELVSGQTYVTTGTTDVSCSIYGNGATIEGYLRVTGDDLVLRDFELLGTDATIGIYLAGSTVVPTRYYRQKIKNVNISFKSGVATANSFGLYASNIDNLVVSSCNIKYGIQLIGCTDYLIDGNILDGNNYANNNELIHASLKSVGQIVNNMFKDSLDNYIDLYPSGAKTIVANNRFLGCKTRTGSAIELKVTLTDTSNTSSDTNGWEEQIVISNNYFGNTQAYAEQFTSIISIFYLDSRAVPSFSWADVPRNITIAYNIFDGFNATSHGSNYFSAIYLNTVAGVIIQGNTVRNMALGTSSDISSCVWVEKCQDVVIDSNRFSMKNGTGVSLHDANTNLTITNNHMLDDLNKSHKLNYGIRMTKVGSRPDPTVTFSKFSGNTISASLATFRQLYYAGSSMNDCIVTNNVFKEQTDFQVINRCIISGNKFYVGATRTQALGIGTASVVCAYNTITNNQVESNTGTPKTGISISRMRGSNVSGNTIKNANYGLIVEGTSKAGELDYMNIKDNFSVLQIQVAYPYYSAMAAGDTASLQAVNNQKIT